MSTGVKLYIGKLNLNKIELNKIFFEKKKKKRGLCSKPTFFCITTFRNQEHGKDLGKRDWKGAIDWIGIEPRER